jgi:hypothetical protein
VEMLVQMSDEDQRLGRGPTSEKKTGSRFDRSKIRRVERHKTSPLCPPSPIDRISRSLSDTASVCRN